MNIQKIFRPAAVAVMLPLTCATIAHAGGLYLGVSATIENFDAEYDKTTINGQGSPRGANTFRSNDSPDETMQGLGVLIGYRMPLGEGGMYLGGELDFAHHSGTVQGYLPEAGNAESGRNEWGESWDEDWSYEKERSYGLTLKLGMPVETWMGGDASLYALAGVRRADTRIDLSFEGCETAAACNNTNLTPGEFNRTETVTGWTFGGGFEKMLGAHTAFRTEIRYTDYENNRWVSFPAAPDLDILRIPASVDSDEFGLSLGLVRYF